MENDKRTPSRAKLKKKHDGREILISIQIADTFLDRMIGLLGTSTLPDGHGLWIKRCNSIHTFFMKYSIDCIFLDSELKVVSLVSNVKPWKIVWPQMRTQSVIEMTAGQLNKMNLSLGEELYVGN